MSLFRSSRLVAVGLTLAVFAAGCASAGSTTAPTAGSSAAAGGVTVGTASGSLGTFLTGPNGLTLYTKSTDSANTSTCTGNCATNWPALKVPSGQQATAGAGVTGTLASFALADGTMQVTYNGRPLYYWIQDKAPGDTTGNGVGGFAVALAAGSAPASGAPASSPAASTSSGY
jgi:predicted lipoprotein with Yx(FWY)xxD motif